MLIDGLDSRRLDMRPQFPHGRLRAHARSEFHSPFAFLVGQGGVAVMSVLVRSAILRCRCEYVTGGKRTVRGT
eukprot:6547602-Prymnesium_polylepis.2